MISLKEIVSFVEEVRYKFNLANTHIDSRNVGLAKDLLDKGIFQADAMFGNLEKSQPMIITKEELGNVIIWDDDKFYNFFKDLYNAEELYDDEEDMNYIRFVTIPPKYAKDSL